MVTIQPYLQKNNRMEYGFDREYNTRYTKNIDKIHNPYDLVRTIYNLDIPNENYKQKYNKTNTYKRVKQTVDNNIITQNKPTSY